MSRVSLSAGVPTPGTTSRLIEVSCTSASRCFAVGSYENSAGATLNGLLRWNGGKWSLVSVPQPAGTANGDTNSLNAVTCTSASSCWAVGQEQQAPSPPAIPALLNEVLRWNGKHWSAFSVPQPAGTGDGAQNQLFGVACAGAGDCWATGLQGTENSSRNQALHWNGRKWQYVSTPHPGTQSLLERDTCASVSDCWAAGFAIKGANQAGPEINQLLHWNGKKWSEAVVPQPAGTSPRDGQLLAGVSCTSSRDCWATGAYVPYEPKAPKGQPAALNQALHWNGKKWSQAVTPEPAGTAKKDFNGLLDVSCVSVSKCFAAGFTGTATGDPMNQVLRWNGKRWSAASVPQPAGTTPQDVGRPGLYGISCVSASDCWAVGTTHLGSNPFLNQVLRLHGNHWSRS
ncbi:MAG TPA: hypothetical protein VFB39_18355 [Solirubrobacteraceae bacterium]|nr:hypothetical protein [Solirubrobacteraceae bacterium]